MRWRTLTQEAPRIIAHRGASGLRPEHTLEAYALALAQAADVIEPDLLPSADAVLFARHETSLARSSDICVRPQFAERQREGAWHVDDLLAAEIDVLRARQPFLGRSGVFDDACALPRWTDVIGWAAKAAQMRGAAVILYPELKQPTALAKRGIDPVPVFIDSVAQLPPGVALSVQCFEPEPLRRVFEATGLPCTLLLDSEADWQSAIAEHCRWLNCLGVNKLLLHNAAETDAGLVAVAHAAGLQVDAWTFRDDAVANGFASIEAELHAAMRLGVDGLFCDFPATAIAARAALCR